MKLSISLPDEDVEFLDVYAASAGFASRSAVLHRAVRLLRASELGAAYEEAFADWEKTAAGRDWETTAGDGLRPDAAR